MVVSVTGTGYWVENAIVSSLPTPPKYDDACEPGSSCSDFLKLAKQAQRGSKGRTTLARRPAKADAGSKAPQAASKVPAKPAYYHEDEAEERRYEAGPTLYRVPYAWVYSGALTVNSRLHKSEFTQGWMELTSYICTEGAEPVRAEDVGDANVLDPYRYKLSFIKPKGY